MRAIIKSVKHYFHTPVTSPLSGTVGTVILVDAIVEGAARANAFDVFEGSSIKAVYVEYWISGVTLDKTATWCILKRPANVAAPTFAEMANLGSYANKKNILNVGS